jgi:hypothetical protein
MNIKILLKMNLNQEMLVVLIRVPVGSRIFISPCHPDRLWGPPYPMGTEGFSLGVKRQGMKLNTYLQLVQRPRKCGSIHPLHHIPSWRSALLVEHRDNFTF